MPSVPNSITLDNIADGADVIASPLRGNFAAAQTAINGIIAILQEAAAKGDLLVATSDDNLSRLAAGANNLVLTADSAQASGMKWAASPTARAKKTSGTQSISNASSTIASFDAEDWDTDTIHDNSSNPSRMTCKTPGKYLVEGTIVFAVNTTGGRGVSLLKNGSAFQAQRCPANPTGGENTCLGITGIVDLGTNDYVELSAYQTSGGSLDIVASDAGLGGNTHLSITRVA